jgi:DNA (cytosine-5)-methyltransferase 1
MLAIDLFAGCGGLSLGLKEAGLTTICAVEIDPTIRQTYSLHSPDVALLGDINEVDFTNFYDKVDIVYGGPPCQSFSVGGKLLSADDSRNGIPSFIRAVREINPKAFLMENVPGLLVGKRQIYFQEVLNDLRSLGFNVFWQVLDATNFLVPQKRKRLFVVGLKQGIFVFPTKQGQVTVNDVLPEYQIGLPTKVKIVYAKNPILRRSVFAGHLFNGSGQPIDRHGFCNTIVASSGGNRTHFFCDIEDLRAYHASLWAGGKPRSGEMAGRRLTVLESQILQTFPEDMIFCGSRSLQYHQIGNAVPPKLAYFLGRQLLESLEANGEK